MNANHVGPGNLKLIQGGLYPQTTFGAVRIVVTPDCTPPFKLDAMVFEEDTWLVMSAAPTVCEPEVHPIRLMTEAINAKPEPVGRVMVQKGDPLRFLAIVHDVNQDPTWKESWIEKALLGVFKAAELRKVKSIGLPMLGTRHGRLEKNRCVSLLAGVLKQTAFRHLKQIWLIVPPGSSTEIIRLLETELVSA